MTVGNPIQIQSFLRKINKAIILKSMMITHKVVGKSLRATIKVFYCFLIMFILSGGNINAQSKLSDKYYSKGMEAFERENYSEAIDWFSKADVLDEKEISPESNRYGYCKQWLAHCYYLLGDEEKAKKISREDYLIRPTDRRITLESDAEGDLANEAYKKGDLQQALDHALKCIELEEKKLGRVSCHYAGTCLFICKIFDRMHDKHSVLRYCNEGLSVLEALGMKNDYITFQLLHARVLANLGFNLYVRISPDMERLEDISHFFETEYNDRYSTATVKILFSMVEMKRGEDMNMAAKNTEEAFKILVELYNPDDEDLFLSMLDCLTQLDMIEKTELVSKLIREALTSLEEKRLKDVHKGQLLSWLGNYAEDTDTSRRCYEQAASFLKKSGYTNIYYLNQCLLASTYLSEEDYTKAESLYIDVCRHYEESTLDKNTGVYRRALMDLGDIYLSLGQIDSAASKYQIVLSLLENDKTNPDYILTFFKWIPICAQSWANPYFKNKYGDGFAIGQELRNILSSLKIQDFQRHGIGLPQIAHVILPFYHALLSQAIIIPGVSWQQIESDLRTFVHNQLIPKFSLNHKVTCSAIATLAHANYLLGNFSETISLINQCINIAKQEGWEYDHFRYDLAFYQYDSGDREGAFDNFKVGYDFLKNEMLKKYRWMTIEERTAYTAAQRGNLDNIPHFAAITPEDNRYAELGYNALLFTKGMLLNSSIELVQLLQDEGDRRSISLLDEWRKLNLKIQASGNLNDSEVAKLREKALRLERQLIESSRTFGDYTKGLTVEYKDVQSGLDEKDVAIEIFSYNKDATSRQYGALMLTKHGLPKYVDIGCDKDWHISNLSIDCYNSSALFDSIFKNLINVIPQREEGKVYFSPDGILHNIALENMPGAEKYDLRRVSSTREIAMDDKQPVNVKSMVLFGGISYGLGEVASFCSDSGSGIRNSGPFLENLPGTKIETEQIYDMISSRCKTAKHTESKATKNKFKQLSGSRMDIVHIATHGFFEKKDGIYISDENPLSSSGLYFAGAQNTLWNMDVNKGDDGILTAYEISQLDLRGLKLAVLSACETGLGILDQDGVFGLQRGFKQAGAKSILMSLWKVDDEATRLLMTSFYRNLINGDNQYDALRKAKDDIKRQYEDPKYWAAFILIDADQQIKI